VSTAAAAPRSGHGVAFRGVRHAYTTSGRTTLALERIDLDVGPGEFVCVIGASGCGKSTLLQALAGFVRPTEGVVEVDGSAVSGPDPSRGVVFQQASLFPWLSVRDNVAYGPRMRGVSRSQWAPVVDDMLGTVGLSDFAGRAPYELSGGMQQRAAIARVLVNDPAVVVMDEPFGALDALTRDNLQEELLSIWRSTGRTILFVTHSVEEAVYLGTRVVVMSPRPGRIVDDIDVALPHLGVLPGREVRTRPEFVAMRERVTDALYAAMGDGGGAPARA
jgi:ABC-type nitrate/sulfonate/bicarbonate transport system ATPase subunit